ncbi:MAG: hypothetical protein Q9183_000468 [Haloplaca sp. 2 TL-2023]
MATAHAFSRRKPTIYGKASRRPFCDLFASSTVDSPLDHDASHHPERKISLSEPTKSDSHPLSGDKHRVRTGALLGSHPQHSAEDGLHAHLDKDTADWDFPSDEPSSSPRVNREHRGAGKKRKLGGSTPARASPPHAAHLELVGVPASESGQDSYSKRKSWKPRRPESQAPSLQPEEAGSLVDSQAPALHMESAIASPDPPMTPPREVQRSPATATTPKQQQLWSMLLPKNTRALSHPSLDPCVPGKIRSTQSPLSPPTLEKPHDPEDHARSVLIHKNRRKLVDSLQQGAPRGRSRSQSPSCEAVVPETNTENAPALKASMEVGTDESLQSATVHPSRSLEPGPGLVSGISKPTRGLKATYSNQRSYLAAGDWHGPGDTSLVDLAMMDDGLPASVTLREERKKAEASMLSVDHDKHDAEPASDALESTSMRTIHELRESGENVRHVNDTEALFDEIDGYDGIPPASKRERLLELLRRLQEPTYCRLVLDQGFDTRLVAQYAGHANDAVTDLLVALALLHLLTVPSGGQTICSTQVAENLASHLTDDRDLISVIRDRRSNISRKGQVDLTAFLEGLSHSAIWENAKPTKLTHRLVGLQSLDYLVRKRREAGCKSEILPPKSLEGLVETLPRASVRSAQHLTSDLLLKTRLAVSVLESCTISGVNYDDKQWTKQTLGPLLEMLPWLSISAETDIRGLRILVLRLYLNLTNNNPRLCHHFAKPEVIRAMVHVVCSHFRAMSHREQQACSPEVLDTLILALGGLINLVEWSSAVRLMMTQSWVEDECLLHGLLTLFLSRRKMVAKVRRLPRNAASFGLTSPGLFGRRDDVEQEHSRQIVAKRLDDESLRPLLDAVEEFLQYHRQIDQDLVLTEGEMDLKATFVSRLEKVVDRMISVS